MDLKRRKRAKTSLGVPADGPQTTETGKNVVWGAGGWTSNDGNGRKRRLGCRPMDLKRWIEGEKGSGEDGKVGLVGKARSVEGDAPEKVATRPLPLRFACGPLPLMMPRVAHFSGASPSTDLQIQHTTVFWGAGGWTSNAKNGQNRRLRCRQMDLKRRKRAKPSSGVSADGPQTPKTGETVVWGAGRWTPNAENGQNRRLGCQLMDPKRRKRAKSSSEVPVDGPQAPKTGKTVVWGAGGWTPNDGNGRNRRLGCRQMDLKRRKS